MKKILKLLPCIFYIFYSLIWADSLNKTDLTINQLLNSVRNLSLEQRIVSLSEQLLQKPYVLEPVGEGPTGQYNQEPLYRVDVFDCVTYVDSVLALALANNLREFQNNYQKINYYNGEIAFTKRCHFTDADWVPNNIKNGFIKDITQQVVGTDTLAIAKANIDRKNWYQHLPLDRIKIPNISATQQTAKLKQLHDEGLNQPTTQTSTQFIPLTQLLSNSKPNLKIINKIPNGTIILFVRENPRLIKEIGTETTIAHLGFVIWKNDKAYVRAASSLKGQTIDLPLVNYLQGYLHGSTLKGIALYQVMFVGG